MKDLLSLFSGASIIMKIVSVVAMLGGLTIFGFWIDTLFFADGRKLEVCTSSLTARDAKIINLKNEAEKYKALMEDAELSEQQTEANLATCKETILKLNDDTEIKVENAFNGGKAKGYKDAKKVKCKNTGIICFDITSE